MDFSLANLNLQNLHIDDITHLQQQIQSINKDIQGNEIDETQSGIDLLDLDYEEFGDEELLELINAYDS